MRKTSFPAVLVQVAAMVAAAAVTRAEPLEFQAETSDDRKVVGAIEALDTESVTLRTSDGSTLLPAADIAALSPPEPAARSAGEPAVWISLADGSTLNAAQWVLNGAVGRVTLLDGRQIDVPRRALESVRFQSAAEAVAEQWIRLVHAQYDGDIVIIRKEDHLDFLRGIVRGASEETVEFDMDGDVLQVKRNRLFGIVLFRPAGSRLPEAVCRITDQSGSEWFAQSLALQGELAWTTPAGVAVTQPLTAIAQIDFSSGRIVYLGDLQPQSVDWQPFFPMDKELASRRGLFQPRRNRGLESEVLELGGTQYKRGLAMRSRSEVVYRLPDEVKRLKATAGIDDRVRPLGNVSLVIRGDGKTLFEGTLTGTEPPVQLDLDITGVRRLSILCDYGEGMDIGDHLNLCDLRAVK
ncbi:MAG: NPCBM/NEW2 domain-containing protein [Thermoguttaceae bacterium]|jgi:hypothetical protein|nr:NPCBM/NEW2 domain-containing protein [Thermoguttaceae bacterium]